MHFIEHFVEEIIAFLSNNIWLGLLISPILGLLMSLMPCCLAGVGIVTKLVDKEGIASNETTNQTNATTNTTTNQTGDKKKTYKSLRYSLIFALGSIVIFFVIGLLIGILGDALSQIEWLFHILVGGILIFFSIYYIIKTIKNKHQCCGHEHISTGHTHASCDHPHNHIHKKVMSSQLSIVKQEIENHNLIGLQTQQSQKSNNDLEQSNNIQLTADDLQMGHGLPECVNCEHLQQCDCNCECHIKSKKPASRTKIFGYGILSAIFNIPCSVPVLIAIFSFAAAVGNMFVVVPMILLYAVGHSVLLVAAGVSTSFVKKMNTLSLATKWIRVLKIVLLTAIILLAGYIIYEGIHELIEGANHDHTHEHIISLFIKARYTLQTQPQAILQTNNLRLYPNTVVRFL